MSAVKRIALVGAGNMGANHARVIAQSEQATLAVLVDPRESVGRAMAERLGRAGRPSCPTCTTSTPSWSRPPRRRTTASPSRC